MLLVVVGASDASPLSESSAISRAPLLEATAVAPLIEAVPSMDGVAAELLIEAAAVPACGVGTVE